MFQHARPVEKMTAKSVKRRVKDDHLHFARYLDTLRSFMSYVCKLNLMSSSAHTIRTTHTHKIGLPAFDTKSVKILSTHTHMVIKILCRIQWTLLTDLSSRIVLQMLVSIVVKICLGQQHCDQGKLILILIGQTFQHQSNLMIGTQKVLNGVDTHRDPSFGLNFLM